MDVIDNVERQLKGLQMEYFRLQRYMQIMLQKKAVSWFNIRYCRNTYNSYAVNIIRCKDGGANAVFSKLGKSRKSYRKGTAQQRDKNLVCGDERPHGAYSAVRVQIVDALRVHHFLAQQAHTRMIERTWLWTVLTWFNRSTLIYAIAHRRWRSCDWISTIWWRCLTRSATWRIWRI